VFQSFFVFCVAGGMFNNIRGTSWVGMGSNGVEWIARQARHQHGIETLLAGSACILHST